MFEPALFKQNRASRELRANHPKTDPLPLKNTLRAARLPIRSWGGGGAARYAAFKVTPLTLQ
jgi:hypothetical protein